MSTAILMATFPYTPSFSYLGHPHVPAQEDVALASDPEHKVVGGGHVYASEIAQKRNALLIWVGFKDEFK